MDDTYNDKLWSIEKCTLKDAKPLKDAGYDDWNTVLERATYVPVEYTLNSLRYQYEYSKEVSECLVDLSHVLYSNGFPIAVWPLTVKKTGGVWTLCTNEGEVKPPLFVCDVQEKLKKKIINFCFDYIKEIFASASGSNIISDSWKSKYSLLDLALGNDWNVWYRKCMENGAESTLVHELYCDLELDIEEIHKRIRKSYKSLINEGERLWKTQVLTSVSDDVFEEFRLKHIEVSGRKTRSKSTWDIQKESINNGDDFLVIIRNEENRLIGGSYFETSRDEGIYAVGVYDRRLFDRPLAHVAQWMAIKHMKKMGLKRYKLGRRYYYGDKDKKPDEKECSISYFKEGFSTDMFLKVITDVAIS